MEPFKQPDLHLYHMIRAISCFTDFTQIPLNSYTWVQFNILLTLLNHMKDLVRIMLEKLITDYTRAVPLLRKMCILVLIIIRGICMKIT